MKLKGKALRLLKTIHIFAACCWLGTGVSLLLLSLGKARGWFPPEAFYGVDAAAHMADQLVLVDTGVLLCVVTGLIYGLFTDWGFFRHRWIAVKWIMTAACIGFGTWLGGLETSLLRLSGEMGPQAASSAEYLSILRQHLIGSGMQIAAVLAMVGISVFKPWKK